MEKAFMVLSYGRGEVQGTQTDWEGTSASLAVGKTSDCLCGLEDRLLWVPC